MNASEMGSCQGKTVRCCLETSERRLAPGNSDALGIRFSLVHWFSSQQRSVDSIPLLHQELVVGSKREGRDAPVPLPSFHRLSEDLYWTDELQDQNSFYQEFLIGCILGTQVRYSLFKNLPFVLPPQDKTAVPFLVSC